MSLHTFVSNKQKPFYRCVKSVHAFEEQGVNDRFNIGWEYPKDYVEKRVEKHLLTKYFNFVE